VQAWTLSADVQLSKAPKPASFEERLAMMSILVDDIQSALAPSSSAIDIAITKHARFVEKFSEVAQHYPGVEEQVYLTGYDTLIRILDTKYYPATYTLESLEKFFEGARIRCMYRLGDQWGERIEQDRYLEGIRNGSKEAEGCKREWGDRIEFIVC
jgi:nicotinamide-nucleotide adenylyltransferase